MSAPLIKVANRLRVIAFELAQSSHVEHLSEVLDKYGIKIDPSSDQECIGAFRESISRLPPELVRDCGIKLIGFRDMGPSKEYYPNHGKYQDGAFILNTNVLDDNFLDVDLNSGSAINKLDQTIYHELGHGWDEVKGNGKELSLQPEWLSLSGWSEQPKPGYKRIRIRDKGAPEMVGEWYYSPDAKFTRFYAKRNPWDDFADSFAYYVGGLKGFLPKNKLDYLERHLGSYFKEDKS